MDSRTIITAYGTGSQERHEYYTLDIGSEPPHRLLEEEHELVVNTVTGHVTLVDWKEQHFKAQCSFTGLELPLIRQLCEDWPEITPYEEFISHLFSSSLAAQMYACLRTARERGDRAVFAITLEPVRVMLSQCQERLRTLGLQIINVPERGYHLIALTKNAPSTKQGNQA